MLITLIGILLLVQILILAVRIIWWLSKPVIYVIGGFAALILIINLLPVCGALILLPLIVALIASCVIIAAIL